MANCVIFHALRLVSIIITWLRDVMSRGVMSFCLVYNSSRDQSYEWWKAFLQNSLNISLAVIYCCIIPINSWLLGNCIWYIQHIIYWTFFQFGLQFISNILHPNPKFLEFSIGHCNVKSSEILSNFYTVFRTFNFRIALDNSCRLTVTSVECFVSIFILSF